MAADMEMKKDVDDDQELPLDIMESEILPILPAKSVGLFRCVSRHWLSFLSTREFTENMHLRNTIITNRKPCLFLIDWRSSASSIRIINYCEESESCDDDHHADHSSSTTIMTITDTPFTAHPSDVSILASLHGLVCVCLKKTCELVLWNPLTCEYNKLPNSKSEGFYRAGLDVVGLYNVHDSASSVDYRILHVKRRRDAMGAYVYSRTSNSWRKVGFLKKRNHIYNYTWSPITFSGGSLYFTVNESRVGGETLIIGFDVNLEKFREIRSPDVVPPIVGVSCQYSNLVDIGNDIHLFVSHEMLEEGGDRMVQQHNWEIDLWRLQGDQRWIKVASFSFKNVPWIPEYVQMWNGEWLVVWDGRDVYKIDTKSTKKDVVCLHSGGGNWCLKLEQTIYIESLVSPNQH